MCNAACFLYQYAAKLAIAAWPQIMKIFVAAFKTLVFCTATVIRISEITIQVISPHITACFALHFSLVCF